MGIDDGDDDDEEMATIHSQKVLVGLIGWLAHSLTHIHAHNGDTIQQRLRRRR